MDPNQNPPIPEEQGANQDHLLEDLVAATSLFDPAQIWQHELELDKLDEPAAADRTDTESTDLPVV